MSCLLSMWERACESLAPYAASGGGDGGGGGGCVLRLREKPNKQAEMTGNGDVWVVAAIQLQTGSPLN
jgi:hypothetical protein